MKNLRNIIPLAIFFSLLTFLYAPSCAMLQQTPEAQAAGLDFAVLAELIPALINSDQLSTTERIELLERAKAATTDPRIHARIDRELARQWSRLASEVSPPPEAPPQAPPATNDQAFFRDLRWLRTDPAAPNAVVTKRLHSLEIRGRNVFFQADDLSDWPTGVHSDTHGVMCIAVNRNGRWEGGKFDHVRRNTRQRDFNNIGEYLRVNPRPGEPVRFWIVNYAGTQASNTVETTWK